MLIIQHSILSLLPSHLINTHSINIIIVNSLLQIQKRPTSANVSFIYQGQNNQFDTNCIFSIIFILKYLILIINLLCLAPIFSKRDLTKMNLQTGKISMYKVQTISDYYYFYYRKTFSIGFANIPMVVVVMSSIQNCPGDNRQFIFSYYANNIKTTTQFEFYGLYYKFYSFDSSYSIKVNYFAYDPIIISNIQSLESARFDVTVTSTQTLTFASDITHPSIYKACFFNILYNELASASPYVVTTTCTAINPTTLQFTYHSTATSFVQSTQQRKMSFFGLIIRPDDFTIMFPYGVATASPSSSLGLPLKTQTDSIMFLIGIVGFNSIDGCLKMNLDTTQTLVSSLSTVTTVSYVSFQIFYKWVVIVQFRSFPFKNKVQYIFQNMSDFVSGSTPVFGSSSLSFSSFNMDTLQANVAGGLVGSITVTMNIYKYGYSKKTKFNYRIITLEKISIEPFERVADLIIINSNIVSTLSNYEFNTKEINPISLSVLSSSRVSFVINYTKAIIGSPFILYYNSPSNTTQVLIQCTIPTIIQLLTSIYSTTFSLTIAAIPDTTSTTHTKLGWFSTNVITNTFQMATPNGSITAIANYAIISENESLIISYIPGNVNAFKAYISFQLITIKYIEVTVNTTSCNITFINLPKLSFQSISQITFNNPSIEVISRFQEGNQLKIQVNYNKSILGQLFSGVFTPTDNSYKSIVNDLKILERLIKFEVDIFDHWLNLTFSNEQGLTTVPGIVFSHPNIVLHNQALLGNKIVIATKFNKTVDGSYLQIMYEVDPSTLYYEIIKIHLVSDFIIAFCVAPFERESNSYYYVGMFLVVLYWTTFTLGIFTCQKIYAVEMMFAIQFSYISLIPIGTYCPPFTSLEILKYSLGWNGIPFPVLQKQISIFYKALGIKSNFISNFNFMILPLILCPVFYFILTKLGMSNNHYRTKPRLLTYGKTFLLDIPFTIILINTPNICASFVVNIQTFGTSNILPLVISILMILLIAISGILFIVFRLDFKEYKDEFSVCHSICNLDIQKSSQIKRYYPIIILLEMACLSTILAYENIFEYSLYISLGILTLITAIILIITPYKTTFDNIRLLVHRFLLMTICGLQVGFKLLRTEEASQSSIVYVYPWFILMILMVEGLVVGLPYVIFKGVMWIKSKGIIDISLYNKQKKLNYKPFFPRIGINPPILYPALQFSRFRNRAERDEADRQILLQVQQINPARKDSQMVWEESVMPI